jgi:hypothetical protein
VARVRAAWWRASIQGELGVLVVCHKGFYTLVHAAKRRRNAANAASILRVQGSFRQGE